MVSYLLEHARYMNLIGIAVILATCWLFSYHREKINYRVVLNGLLLQFIIGFFILKTGVGHSIFEKISFGIGKLYEFGLEGTKFLFGSLAVPNPTFGFVFAFGVLPIIVFFGAFMAILFHLGIIQFIVTGVSRVIRPIFGTSGAETLSVIANSFLGQTEAPLVVRHYLASMTSSEVVTLMISGMAHVSGSILVLYAAMGVPAPHLLAASIMALPGTIVIAKMLMPETAKPQTAQGGTVKLEATSANFFGAIAHGTSDGMYLALNVGAMLVAFIALIACVNSLLGSLDGIVNALMASVGSDWTMPHLTLDLIFSYVFAPFSYLLGFSGEEALKVGQLLGTKLTINEFVAYSEMVKQNLSERTVAIVTYALCGFANFSSIGIQIGGIGALVPSKREELGKFAMVALLGGSLSNLLSAMIAALLI
jgi:concentrative nucleoside transporter, CNT family